MGFLEEGVVEGGALGGGNIVVLVRQPAVPLGGNHLSGGAANGKEVVVLNPSSLTAVWIRGGLQRGSKSS